MQTNSPGNTIETKYKVLGSIDLLLGFGQVIIPLMMLFLVIPKLNTVYSDFNVAIDPNLTYGTIGIILLMGTLNIFLGLMLLLKSSVNRDRYFTPGIISAVVTAVATLFLFGLSQISIFGPLYNLAN